jgi:uncharacterized protein YgiM (DUF1202 family)
MTFDRAMAVLSGAQIVKRLRLAVTAVLLLLLAAHVASAQAPANKAPAERVRVPTSYANVHRGPSSGQEVLVLVPKGTVLTVLGRDREWLQVQLTPELRKTGMVMRWYKNEDRGWMHDSTVEVVKAEAK